MHSCPWGPLSHRGQQKASQGTAAPVCPLLLLPSVRGTRGPTSSRQKPLARTTGSRSTGSGVCGGKPVSLQASPHAQSCAEQLAPECTQRPRTASALQIPPLSVLRDLPKHFPRTLPKGRSFAFIVREKQQLNEKYIIFFFLLKEVSKFMLMSECF